MCVLKCDVVVLNVEPECLHLLRHLKTSLNLNFVLMATNYPRHEEREELFFFRKYSLMIEGLIERNIVSISKTPAVHCERAFPK